MQIFLNLACPNISSFSRFLLICSKCVNIFCIVGVVEILGSSCARENMFHKVNLLLVGNSGVQWLLAMIPASQANVSFALDPGKTAPH